MTCSFSSIFVRNTCLLAVLTCLLTYFNSEWLFSTSFIFFIVLIFSQELLFLCMSSSYFAFHSLFVFSSNLFLSLLHMMPCYYYVHFLLQFLQFCYYQSVCWNLCHYYFHWFINYLFLSVTLVPCFPLQLSVFFEISSFIYKIEFLSFVILFSYVWCYLLFLFTFNDWCFYYRDFWYVLKLLLVSFPVFL